MNETPLHLAKRELHALATRPPAWIGIAAAGLILGVMGPFGTDSHLRLLPRLAYWLVVTAASFATGTLVTTFLRAALGRRGLGHWPATAIAGVVAGLAVFVVLALINWGVFAITPRDPGYAVGLAINAVVISVIVAGALAAIDQHLSRAASEAARPDAAQPDAPQPDAPRPAGAAPAPARLLARLPLEKRGRLLALSVQDHYTEVFTDKGRALVLLRLSDAIAEAGDTAGLQVHRSHWVALDAVRAARRDGARALLTLSDGRDIPVSRTYVQAVKEAGLLPG